MKRLAGSKKACLLVLKIAVSMTLLGWLIASCDLSQMVSTLRGTALPFLVVAFCFSCVRNVVQSLRWWVVLRVMNRSLSPLTLVRLFFIGVFFNLLLPSAAGGDFVRGWLASSRGLERGEAFGSVLVDRLIGIFTTVFLAAVSALLFRESILNPTLRLGVLALPIGCGLMFWLFTLRPDDATESGPDDSWWSRLKNQRSRLAGRLRKNPIKSVVAFGLSLVGCLLAIGGTYCLALAVDAPVSGLELALMLPLVWLFTMLPLSIGGFGLREGAMVFFLGQAGVARETALGICLLWVIVMLAQAAVGALFFTFEGVKMSALRSAQTVITKRFTSFQE